MGGNHNTEGEGFGWIDETVRNASHDAALEAIVQQFKQDKHYDRVLKARLMRARLDLGLPLTANPSISELPDDVQQQYQDAYVKAAREVGGLFLGDGNIPEAWPYLRAIGEAQLMVAALDAFEPDAESPESLEHLGAVIQIAFDEGVHPRKGFELMLQHYGMCRAVTMFGAYPGQIGREASLKLLVRSLHGEIAENLKLAIAAKEGTRPQGDSIPALIAGRDWLFDKYLQYTDSSHLAALLRFCSELEDKSSLTQAAEIAAYGCRLDEMFQCQDDPPFDRGYEDYRLYLGALIGEDVDRAVAHFEARAAAADLERDGSRPAEVLVQLLSRLGRHADAIKAFRRNLTDAPPERVSCPNLAQLCEMAGDLEQLKEVARQNSDPLGYLAAAILGHSASEVKP
jgi:hypothetical protein